MLKTIFSTITRMMPYQYQGQLLPCNLCGKSKKQTISTKDRYFRKLHTVMCTNCGLVFTDPMPTEEEVSQYYKKHYRLHYHNDIKPSKRAIYKNFKGASYRYLSLKSILKEGSTLIDIGSGGGEFVSYLNTRGIKAKGLEPNEHFSTYARQTYDIPVETGMWESASFEPESTDVITACHVLEHFRDPHAAMSQFWRWLKPGGYLHISVPNIINPKGTPISRFHFAHLYNFSPKTLLMMAKKTGFEATTILAPQSTNVILQKQDKPQSNWFIANNHAAQMRNYFNTYTNRRYFLSPQPYMRWIVRMSRLFNIMLKSAKVRKVKKSH
jgi:2-polyprenyl-3-methyl-5-hydroxy-6-metoxy-1,4-benzoquinol methylase